MTFANVQQRIGAFLLDYLVIAAYLVLLIIMSVGLGFGPLQGAFRAMFANPNSSELSAFLLLVLPVILYFALFECSSWQATWGKRRMGLRVVDTHGTRLSFPRSLVRSLLKFLPWELTHACLWRIPGWPLAPITAPPLAPTARPFLLPPVGLTCIPVGRIGYGRGCRGKGPRACPADYTWRHHQEYNKATPSIDGEEERRACFMRIRPVFWLLFALTCVGVLLFAATVRPHVPVIMQVDLGRHEPFSSGVTTLNLHLTDPQGLPLDDAQIVSSASMTNMDMGTHQENVRTIGPGTYIATLELSMAGPWAITVTASRDGFDPVQKTLLVEVV